MIVDLIFREDSAIAGRDHEVSQIILKRNLTLTGGSSLVIGAIIGMNFLKYQYLANYPHRIIESIAG